MFEYKTIELTEDEAKLLLYAIDAADHESVASEEMLKLGRRIQDRFNLKEWL